MELTPSQQALAAGFDQFSEAALMAMPEFMNDAELNPLGLNPEAVTDLLLDLACGLIELEETGGMESLGDLQEVLNGDGQGGGTNGAATYDPDLVLDQLAIGMLLQIMLYAGVGILKLRTGDPVAMDGTAASADKLSPRLREVYAECRDLMLRKNHDYGDSWRYMRVSSITDQILIKVLRLTQLEELDAQGQASQVAEGRESEYRDICNYAILEALRLTSMMDIPELPERKYSKPSR
ncbi:MAG: DUF1599 domain-containing protein [bacterium]